MTVLPPCTHYQSVCVSSGVYWGATPGLPANHPHPAAAAGPPGCAGSQTAPIWRFTGNCGTTQHYCGPGKHIASQPI